jgi:hypothetical protein
VRDEALCTLSFRIVRFRIALLVAFVALPSGWSKTSLCPHERLVDARPALDGRELNQRIRAAVQAVKLNG